MRTGLRVAGAVLLTASLAWLNLISAANAGRVPVVWWADVALVSLMLLDAARKRPLRDSATGLTFSATTTAEGLAYRATRHAVQRRHWPLLLIAGYAGTVIARVMVREPIVQALALSACDMAGAAVAVYGVDFTVKDGVDLTDQRPLLLFVVFAVLCAPLVSSVGAAAALHWLAGSSLALWRRWFPPISLGMCIVPPLVLSLGRSDTWALFRPARLLSTVEWMVTLAAIAAIVFVRPEFALLFLLLPPLLLLVVRLGQGGGALGCCLVAVIGAWFTLARHTGPLAQIHSSLEHRIVLLQLFVAAAVLSVTVVGGVLADLQRARRAFRDSEMRYRSLTASMEMLNALDPLTRLANRRRFDEVLDKEWQRALRGQSPISLILFDADHFKAYNERYGQLAGDECLKRIADAMAQMARRPADLVARFSGEEFGVILPDTDGSGAVTMAENLRQRIESLEFAHAASPSGRITLSGGCATLTPLVGEAPIDLLNSADEALFEAKRQGRNRIQVAVFRRPAALGL